MKSTALGAENIIFISDAHEKFYYEKLQEVRYQDVYHKALCYCLGINGDTRKNADRIYNFKTGSVKTKCLHEGWQTSGSLKVVRMAFNLYCNSTPSVWDYEDAEEQVNECRQYTVEDIFCCVYAPYFWQAIQIRYPEYVVYNQKLHLSDSSEQQSMDLMEEMELFQMNTALVKRNIEYDCLVQRCRLGEQQQLDEIVALIVETISIERENITISGVKYPYQFVKSRLLLLEESHIEYVLDCLHENTREVKNIKAYLLTCLMNSITTIGNYYQAKVNHDMYGGGI